MFGRVVSCVDPITGEVGKQPETLAGPVPGMVNKVELDCDIDYKVVLTNGASGEGTIGQAQNSMTYNPSCVVGTDEFGEDIVKGVLKVDCIKAESIEGSECAKYLYQNEIDCDTDYDLPIWKDDKNAQCFTSMATSSAYPITFNPNKGILCVNEIEADLPSIGCHSDVTLANPVAPYSVLRYNPSTEKFESVQQVSDYGGTSIAYLVMANGCCNQILNRICNVWYQSIYTGNDAYTVFNARAIPPALNSYSIGQLILYGCCKTATATLKAGFGDYYGGAYVRAYTCTTDSASSNTYAKVTLAAQYQSNGPETKQMEVEVCTNGIYFMNYGCSQYSPTSTTCNYCEGYRFARSTTDCSVTFEKYDSSTCTWSCAIPPVETVQTINYASNWSCMTNYIASTPHTGKWLPVNILCTGSTSAYMGFTICDYSVNCSRCVCGTNVEGVIFYHNANSAVGIFHACICGARRQVVVHRHYSGAETVTMTPAFGTFLGEASACVINVKCIL